MTQLGLTLDDRVGLTRVRLFFKHAAGNAARACVGAAMSAIVLWIGGGTPLVIGLWAAGILLVCGSIMVLVSAYRRAEAGMTDPKPWVERRIALGAILGLLYGIAPFFLPLDVSYEYISFIFVANLTMVAVAAMTYPVMPRYYVVLDITAMTPLVAYFLIRFDTFGLILLAATLIWQVIFLRRALDISRATVEGIVTNEKLADEIVEHQRARDQIHYMAFHDSLTGLANRRQFQDSAARTLKVAARAGARIGLAVIDLDHFKPINDSFGHQMGDKVLREVAARLRHATRESDLVARLGGDEFGILIENVGAPTDVAEVARKIEHSLNAPLMQEGQTIPLHASIGFATFPADGSDLDAVFRTADQRMYQKKRGRADGVAIH